jgi:hypothetical protein
MLEPLLEPVVEFVFQRFCYSTARVVVPIFTLGRVYVEERVYVGPNRGKRWMKPRLGRIQRAQDGTLFLEAELASLVGMLFWIFIGIGAYFAFRTT